MPIKNLTDTHRHGTGLPRIGTLYKGDEKPENGNRPGKDLKHFRFEPEPQFEYLADLWEELYSNAPTQFSPVFLFGETADEAFETWLEEWSATGLQHRCDGETQHRWYDKRIGEYSVARVACDPSACQCKRTGRLRLIFPDFVEAAGVLGYIAMTTHSIHDILTLHRYLSDIARLYGKLDGVPFVFGRAEREVSAPKPNEPGKRIKTTKSLLFMHVLPDFTREKLVNRLADEAPQLPAGTELPALRQPDGVRRIEGGEGMQPAERPEWWNEGLNWAKGMFEGLSAADVNRSLEAIAGWQASKETFMAAVICARFNYDTQLVEQFTGKHNLLKVWDIARDICASIERAEGEIVNG